MQATFQAAWSHDFGIMDLHTLNTHTFIRIGSLYILSLYAPSFLSVSIDHLVRSIHESVSFTLFAVLFFEINTLIILTDIFLPIGFCLHSTGSFGFY